MSSLSVSHYQSLDSHERKSIMLSHKVNLVIILFSLNWDVQVEPRSIFSPHRRVTPPRTKLFLPPIKARSKPWLRKPTGWRRRSEPEIIYEGFEPIRYETKQSQEAAFRQRQDQEAEKEIILPRREEKPVNILIRRTQQTANTSRQTPPPHVGVAAGKTDNSHGMNHYSPRTTVRNSNIVRSFENSTMKNRLDDRSQSENNDLNNYGEWISWESRRL